MSNRCYGGNFKEGEETDWTDPEEVCEEDIDIVFPSERQGGKDWCHYLRDQHTICKWT